MNLILQCEQELLEEMLMNQALDEFEDQAEAALYAEQGLRVPGQHGGPRHRQPHDPAANGLVSGMNNLHVNGVRLRSNS